MEAKIRYLKPEEKEKARTLWSQAFFEDSEEFDQYYFTEKIKENQILVTHTKFICGNIAVRLTIL